MFSKTSFLHKWWWKKAISSFALSKLSIETFSNARGGFCSSTFFFGKAARTLFSDSRRFVSVLFFDLGICQLVCFAHPNGGLGSESP